MASILAEFFAQQNFIPHGFCLAWEPGLLGLHVISDAVIAIAYYSIPFALIYFISRRRDLAFRGIFALSGAFILACGTTHIMGIVTLWYPAYWLDGFIKFFTAVVSIFTAAAMWYVMPKALALPSMEQLEEANRRLQSWLISEGHQIPIIFITAFDDDNVRDQALGTGAVGFLVKPFEEADLLNGINLAVQRQEGAPRSPPALH